MTRTVENLPISKMCACDSSDPYDSKSANVIWLVYEERKCLVRAMTVHSYTAPNLPRKNGAITKGQIKKNLRTADLRKSNNKRCHLRKNSVYFEFVKAQRFAMCNDMSTCLSTEVCYV
jgi:hypothetical protein